MDNRQKQIIRQRRKDECFPIINRGVLWYNCLTIEQKSQLNGWYHAWLNATETGVIPPKPICHNELNKDPIIVVSPLFQFYH